MKSPFFQLPHHRKLFLKEIPMLHFILQIHSEYVMYISSCSMIRNIDFLKFNDTKFALWGDLIWFDFLVFNATFSQYFSYIMATSFSDGRSRSTQIEPPTMGKQLVNFITCGCKASAPFVIYQVGREPTPYWW